MVTRGPGFSGFNGYEDAYSNGFDAGYGEWDDYGSFDGVDGYRGGYVTNFDSIWSKYHDL